jgi:hypothetical protein
MDVDVNQTGRKFQTAAKTKTSVIAFEVEISEDKRAKKTYLRYMKG